MPQYKIDFEIPDSIRQFFDAFNGPGVIEFEPGSTTASFTFAADDLWDAAQIVSDVKNEVNANLPVVGEYVELDKPYEVEQPKSK